MDQALPLEVRAGAKVTKGWRSKGPEFDAWQERRAVGRAGPEGRTTMQTVQKSDNDSSCRDDVGLE